MSEEQPQKESYVDEARRRIAHLSYKLEQADARVRKLEYDNAELVKSNEELKERVEKLASRQPQWPKGYRPHKNNRFHKAPHNKRF